VTQDSPASPPDQPVKPGQADQQGSPDKPSMPDQPVGPPPPPPRPEPKKKRRVGLYVTLGVLAVVLLICVAGGVVFLTSAGDEIPEAGQCLNDAPQATDMEVVDCGATDAAWTVLGTGGTMSRGEFSTLTADADVCDAYPTTERALWVTDAFFGVNDDTEGEVICLASVGSEEADEGEEGG